MNLELRTVRLPLVPALAFATLAVSPALNAQGAAEQGYAIEEIVVTAQKREENLQEVPISITALSGAMIEDRGIKNVQDLFTSAPGLVGFEAPSTRGNVSINMRGIGGGSPNNISLDPANAVYVNGVYLGKATGLGVDAFDMERIEILRGPQGTLYGRNSTGGAINFITRRPGDEFGAMASVTAGKYSLKEFKLRVDVPFSDTFLTSFSAHSRERDHLYRNTNAASPGFENIDRQGFRASARWQPNDTFTADYMFDFSEMDEDIQALQVVGFNPFSAGVLAAPGFPANVGIRSSDRIAQIAGFQQFLPFLGPAFFAPQVQQLNQWMTDYLTWANDQLGDVSSRKGLIGSTDTQHNSNNEVTGHALTLAWNFEDLGALGDVEFKSITGYRENDNTNESDLDGTDNTLRPGPGGLTTGIVHELTLLTIGGLFFDSISPQLPGALEFAIGQSLVDAMVARGRAETFNTFITTEYEQFSQELQMVGATDRLDYAIGAFYFDDDGKRRGNSTALFPIASTEVTAFDNSTTAWALYSQMTFRPTVDSRFSITGGLRYTEEEKDITYLWRSSAIPGGFVGAFFGGLPPSAAYADNSQGDSQPEVAGIFGRQFSEKFDNLSGKLTLGLDFTDTINGFVTYSTGYRSGGFNGDAFNALDDTADSFNEETIENFEVGIKSDLFDGRVRLNATYFDYTYEDLQVSTLLARPDGTVTSNTDNAGEAERDGFELELAILPLENLLFSLNYTLTDGDFTKFPPRVAPAPGGGFNTLETTNLAKRTMMPDNQLAFNLDWTIAESKYGLWQLNVNGAWQEEAQPISINGATYDTNGDGIPETPIVYQQLNNDERTVLNARLAVNEIPVGDGTLSIGLWGRNLTNDDYRAFSFNYGAALGLSVAQYGEPITYGLDLIFRY